MKFNKFHLEMVKDKTFNYDNTKVGSSIDIVKLISDLEKLEYTMKMQEELTELYLLISNHKGM